MDSKHLVCDGRQEAATTFERLFSKYSSYSYLLILNLALVRIIR